MGVAIQSNHRNTMSSDSYYLQYGGTEHRGVFIGGSGYYDTLEDAMQHVAQTVQNLVWDS